MQHRIGSHITAQKRVNDARPWAIAVTIVSDPGNRQTPVKFTIDGGDGTVLRGPYDTIHRPRAGQSGLAVRTQNPGHEQWWVVAVWPGLGPPDPIGD